MDKEYTVVQIMLDEAKQLYLKDKHDSAIKKYTKVLALNPNCINALDYLGLIYERRKEFEKVINYRKRLVKLKPHNASAHAKLARAMMAQKNIQGTIASYQKAIALQPDQPARVYIGLGDALNQNRQIEEAITAYQKAIEIKANLNFSVYQKLGEACYKQKQFDKAVEYFMETIKRNPSFVAAYTYLGRTLQELGEENQKNLKKLFSKQHIPRSIIHKFCGIQKDDSISLYNLTNDLHYIEVEPEGNTIQLLKPKTVSNGIRYSFPLIRKQNKAFMIRVVNGRAWGDRFNGAVITSSNQLLREASWNNPELGFYVSNLHSPWEIKGTVAFLAHHSGYRGYYHWMTQVIPQISLLERSGIHLDTINKFAFYKNFQFPFRKETLNILGIPQSKIIELHLNHHIKASSLLVPSFLETPQKWACDFIRNKFLNNKLENVDRSVRVYISRQKASRRRVINHNELVTFLEDFGFKTINLESLSVLEQATLFSKAEIIVAPHGAGLTNLIFCNPGTKVIEILNDSNPPVYQIISSYYNLDYYYLIPEGAEDPQTKQKAESKHNDMNININSLLELMKLAEIRI